MWGWRIEDIGDGGSGVAHSERSVIDGRRGEIGWDENEVQYVIMADTSRNEACELGGSNESVGRGNVASGVVRSESDVGMFGVGCKVAHIRRVHRIHVAQ